MRFVYLLYRDNEVTASYSSLEAVINEALRLNKDFPMYKFTHREICFYNK